jgi:hypothetical protein
MVGRMFLALVAAMLATAALAQPDFTTSRGEVMRYLVDGVETFSSGYTTGSALNFNTRAGAGSVFDRFAIGSTHLCWYDPQHPRTVVLARGPGGAYIFALLPIPVLLIGLSMLGGMRRRNPEAMSGTPSQPALG